MSLESGPIQDKPTASYTTPQERQRVRREADLEVGWWGSQLVTNITGALDTGQLIIVPIEGDGYRLVGVIRRGEEPDLLNPQAYSLLREIIQRWQGALVTKGLYREDIFLSVSSLYRTQEQQRALIEQGANAAEVSAHQAGAAIDFDPSGYYLGPQRSSVTSASDAFRPEYIDELRNLLLALQQEGKCNFILEKRYKSVGEQDGQEYTACYHVCVSPHCGRVGV